MFDVDRQTTVVGFLGAALVLTAIVVVVGVDQTISAILSADLAILVLVLIVAAGWLSAWGLSLRTVLNVVDGRLSVPHSVLVFAGVTFANNVTPFGQAGGEPISAALITRITDNEYETSLAAIASVDAVNLVPSITLALFGFGYVATTTVLVKRLKLAAAGIVLLALAIPVAVFIGWRHRYEIEAVVVRSLTPLIRLAGRTIPRRSAPKKHVIKRRIEGFFVAVDRVAGDRGSLALALGFSTLGWLGLAMSLWLSLLSLGVTTPFATMLVVIPVGAFAGVTPLPGGLGGVEAMLVALLGPAAGVDPATAAGAVLIHRTATYWLPTIVGGGVVSSLGVR